MRDKPQITGNDAERLAIHMKINKLKAELQRYHMKVFDLNAEIFILEEDLKELNKK